MEKIVLDTNILIEVLKGNQTIVTKLEKPDFRYCISSITVMELYYGALNKAELFNLKKFMKLFEVIEVNENIKLYTLNIKDFKYIDGLTLI